MTVRLLHGDCREVLAGLPDDSIDAVVTDPPYELGFMGKAWDSVGIAYDVRLWAEVLRVLKPGGHLLAFGGTRTYHRMACAIEDAGFEVRDSLHWVYGSGFPKSLDVSKAIDKVNGEPNRLHKFTAWMRTTGLTARQLDDLTGTNMGGHYLTAKSQPAIPTAAMWAVIRPHVADVPEWVDELVARIEAEREVVGTADSPLLAVAPGEGRDRPPVTLDITAPATDAAKQWSGWGTALKPAHEPIVVARKPLVGTVAANVLEHGTGALNIDGCRVGSEGGGTHCDNRDADGKCQGHDNAGRSTSGQTVHGPDTSGGRWPANLVFTHAAECGEACAEGCPVAELDGQSGVSKDGVAVNRNRAPGTMSSWMGTRASQTGEDVGYGGKGGASRFFTVTEWDPIADVAPFRYVAKPSKKERNAGLDGLPEHTAGEVTDRKDGSAGLNSSRAGAGRTSGGRNTHPTVKPVALMRWLVRLVTPPGGVVLDPFAGSGTTLAAATLEGFDSIGVELTADYLPIINGRVAWAEAQAEAQPATLFDQAAS